MWMYLSVSKSVHTEKWMNYATKCSKFLPDDEELDEKTGLVFHIMKNLSY